MFFSLFSFLFFVRFWTMNAFFICEKKKDDGIDRLKWSNLYARRKKRKGKEGKDDSYVQQRMWALGAVDEVIDQGFALVRVEVFGCFDSVHKCNGILGAF